MLLLKKPTFREAAAEARRLAVEYDCVVAVCRGKLEWGVIGPVDERDDMHDAMAAEYAWEASSEGIKARTVRRVYPRSAPQPTYAAATGKAPDSPPDSPADTEHDDDWYRPAPSTVAPAYRSPAGPDLLLPEYGGTTPNPIDTRTLLSLPTPTFAEEVINPALRSGEVVYGD